MRPLHITLPTGLHCVIYDTTGCDILQLLPLILSISFCSCSYGRLAVPFFTFHPVVVARLFTVSVNFVAIAFAVS